MSSDEDDVLQKTAVKTKQERLYNKTKETLKDKLKTGNYFCITTDSWTFKVNHNYIAVTAHFIDASFGLRSNLLEFPFAERHTAKNLGEEQKRVAREWNLDK
ncbi:hypothetical protein J437_LFUL012209 [Ladona fulva]|uniref:Uncharacterized protein n=1 Tax=Ladona fulva TaxID=123851 RepID=A0A8K0P9H1_LADFU|nr:hypothetical protein J437_LFUL012209 [Ladona fulva]